MAHPIEEEIQQELKQHKILIYGKGDQDRAPMRLYRRNHGVFQPIRISLRNCQRVGKSRKTRSAHADDQLADPAQGVHQRPILRRYRRPRAHAVQRGTEAAAGQGLSSGRLRYAEDCGVSPHTTRETALRGVAPARRGPFVSAKGPKTIGAQAWPFGSLCPGPGCLGCGNSLRSQTVLRP